ncbi:2-hydroxyacyl-CoA dehydratase [Oxalobacter sp. OttesenSCG-928-P03]|nr:2-hydroxyacyl-CoA dehydratase [Oxalobacter sp. OttesenSCG-928-P03]
MTGSGVFLGLDIGSTTVKAVVLNAAGEIIFSRYTRHLSEVRQSVKTVLQEIAASVDCDGLKISLTGSGAISLASELNIPFVQEVIASGLSIRERIPDADVVIELGGEDAKLTYLTGGLDQRMNETCAGGTGAFIDQMASFVQTDASGLDRLAMRHRTIYPIASRCGVFAKTDVLPLLNEGCSREDIAASIMQAVVNQTISGLARGRPIRGKVVFLGGPLAFLESLRQRFVATLKLDKSEAVFPEHAEYFVALGAALHARRHEVEENLDELINRLENVTATTDTKALLPLFQSEEERADFHARHAAEHVERRDLEACTGDAWLGFDCGSTTIKAALVDENGNLLYSSYSPNKGDPLSSAIDILREIYTRKQPDLHIRATAVTGYGSQLLAAGLNADIDEVETVAHFTAARFFEPKVSFILDIGGQDIKCMRISDGAIASIQLNEACSAGCGSFIENFATSLQMPLPRFVEAAMNARSPVDLGTRCTVFMNSKVKQAQKDRAEVGDIAAGLSYSVVRNACFKVMKITNVDDLGRHVVVQGGAFANDALLRALELELGCTVLRPDISGLMGAYGAALIAKDRGPVAGGSRLLDADAIEAFSVRKMTSRCRQCANSCLLTINTFSNSTRFVSGNRCDRGAGAATQTAPNLYAFKYDRLFNSYLPLDEEAAARGTIGIPRALNIFENYPLWFTIFTRLGFRVELSAPSSKELYFQGYETIPSQTVCYPAKLAHGHVLDLVSRNVDYIFFPCLPKEQKEFVTQAGNYNCPIVIGYPELLAKNITAFQENNIPIIHQFLPLDRRILARRMRDIAPFSTIPLKELEAAVNAGFDEMACFRKDMQRVGEEVLAELEQSGRFGIVLAGHPYHVDPEVHNGISDLITSFGMAVITEDAVAHLMPDPGPLRVVDQWTYHSRLYRAGAYAADLKNIAVMQLVSFGCGIDAVTADQLEEIIRRKGGLYAQIKIDEGVNLGPARIRIRSLLATLRERAARDQKVFPLVAHKPFPKFTREMRHTHTILIPQMSPVHFQFLETVFASEGYKAVQLPTVDRAAIDLGLRYVNNDACYPAIVVVGQLLHAIQNGGYDRDRIALMISQTGGGCRATNYIAFLRKALQDSGLDHIPIISFNMGSLSDTQGIRFSGKLLKRVIMAVQLGDALMRMLCRVTPYEAEPGSAARLAEKWAEKGKKCIASGSILLFDLNMLRMIRAFDRLPLKTEERRPRVGLVGEILLKYHPDANNNAVSVVEQEGGEAVVPDMMDFALYSFYNHIFNYRHLAGSWRDYVKALSNIFSLELIRWSARFGFRRSKRFSPPDRFSVLRKKAENLVSHGHQTGEGWLLTAEMVKLIESGVSNILCMQPFGCLPNHITGKGLFKELKHRYPEANIIALDYDAGASEVNQINRIKLMMAAANADEMRLNA